MKNRQLKIQLCKAGKLDSYCVTRYKLYIQKKYDEMCNPDSYGLTKDEFIACEQMARCKRRQNYIVNKALNNWIKNKYTVYFATFGFNDKSLTKKYRTRRNYITNMLKDNVLDYKAIVDFNDNNREHYHSIFIVDKKFKFNRDKYHKLNSSWLLKYQKNYGWYDVKQVVNNKTDYGKVKHYITKKKVLSVMYKNARLISKKIDKKQPYQVREEDK